MNNLQTEVYEKILKAGEAYRMGDFKLALSSYQSLIDAGEASPGLYYNFGNTAYRLGDASLALAAFRLAKQLKPRDAEISANIDFVKMQSGAQSAQSAVGFFDYIPWHQFGSEKEFLYVSSFFVSLVFLAAALGKIMTRRSFAPAAWIFFIFSIVAIAGLIARNARNEPDTHGVVVAASVSVRSEASEQSLELFQLQKGTEFRVLDRLALNQGLSAEAQRTQEGNGTKPQMTGELYSLSLAAREKNAAPGTWYRIRFDSNTSGFVPAEAVLVY